VLAQIIFEQENKAGQNLLPATFLRQLIRFYGDSMQMLVPRFLEQSLETLTRDQEKFRTQMTNAFGMGAAFAPLEEQVRRNMELFERTFAMFKPFTPPRKDAADATNASEPPKEAGREGVKENGEIDDLRRQMREMQDKLERMSKDGAKD
jgi:polyhydroxyalkanoate synthesis regulator protein